MKKRTDRAGLDMTDVFAAMSAVEKEYNVRMRISIDIDHTVLSGRFGYATVHALIHDEYDDWRSLCKTQVPLPNASTASTEGLLLRAVLTVDRMVMEYYGPNDEPA